MESFSKALLSAEHNQLIHGIKANQYCPAVSHLFFADDCLVFAKPNGREDRNLVNIIEQFSSFSGQSINYEKSGIAFSKKVPNQVKNEISTIMNIKKLALNDKYLGVPLLLQKSKIQSFSSLLDRYGDRLAPWKPKFLNTPGRTVMTQSVLGSLASHHMSVFPIPKNLTDKMDSIQMRFWWNKKTGKRGVFFKKWREVAQPKALGGLNIKQNEIMNYALLAKLAWRMLHSRDELWVQLLEGKYFHNCDPLYDNIKSNGSWIWNGVCRGLEIIKQYACWEVGDGTSINIWKNRWIPSIDSNVDCHFLSHNMKTVSQLIDANSKTWNVQVIQALFDNATVEKILNIRIPFEGKDYLRWQPSSNGQFSVKSAYKAILNSRNRAVGFTNTVPISWKHFWKTNLPNNILHFLWKCLQNCLPVGDKLARFRQNIDPICPLCNMYTETMQHIFIDCSFTKTIWNAIDLNFGSSLANVHFTDWICGLFQVDNLSASRDNLLKWFGFVMWNVWKCRCRKVFDDLQPSVNKVVHRIKLDYSDWISVNTRNFIPSVQTRNQNNSDWQRPENPYIKLNFDAAYKDDTNDSGIGLILRDFAGNTNGVRCCRNKAIDPEQAEAKALLEAVLWARSKGVQTLHLEGDCQNIITALNGGLDSIKWTTRNLIIDCRTILNSFVTWKCTHVHRDANNVAHTLAKHGIASVSAKEWSNNIPLWITQCIHRDDDV